MPDRMAFEFDEIELQAMSETERFAVRTLVEARARLDNTTARPDVVVREPAPAEAPTADPVVLGDAPVVIPPEYELIERRDASPTIVSSSGTPTSPFIVRDTPLDRVIDTRPEEIVDESLFTSPLVGKPVGGANDMVNCYYLIEAERARRTVARLASLSGTPRGTGFLVGPQILMTNHHVLRTRWGAASAVAEFDFVVPRDLEEEPLPTQRHRLRPDVFFYTNSALDFSLCYVDRLSHAGVPLESRLWCPLPDRQLDDGASHRVNIIQHPEGGPQQIALRENKIVQLRPDPARPHVARRDPARYIHYRADTQHMSSGSPVWNDNWDLIALHHKAIATRPLTNPIVWEANEGVRADAIAAHLAQAFADKWISEATWFEHVSGCFQKPSRQPAAAAPAMDVKRAPATD